MSSILRDLVKKSGQNAAPWDVARGTVSKSCQERFEGVRKWAEAVAASQSLPSDLAQIDHEQSHPIERLHELTSAIVKEFGRGDDGREALVIIRRVIEAYNRTSNVPLPVPDVPRRLKRQINPFERSSLVASLRVMRALRTVESSWIAPSSSDPSPKGIPTPIDRIMVSAIVEGGLLHLSMIEALLDRLRERECPIEWWGETPSTKRSRPKGEYSRPFIDLSLGWRATDDAELRRWFPDPQTAVLIARAYDTYTPLGTVPETDKVVAGFLRTVRNALQQAGLNPPEVPRSLAGIFSSVRVARFSDNYPALIVNYCSRRIISHSLRRSLLPRLVGQEPWPEPDLEQVPGRSDTDSRLQPVVGGRSDQITESAWYGMLRLVLKSERKKKGSKEERRKVIAHLAALEKSDQYESNLSSCFFRFARFQLEKGSAAGNRLADSTVRNYVLLVSRYLGGVLEGEDPVNLNTEQLVPLYGEAMDAADQGRNVRWKRRQLAQALREFHHFLVTEYQKKGVNPGEVFGIGKELIHVDANLLTPDEYFRVRELLLWRTAKTSHEKIAPLLLSLGFWLGLRRSEARGLRTIDVSEMGIPMLIIRPWEERQLKTTSSARLLPLELMPEEELRALLEWKEIRKRQKDSGQDQRLLASPSLQDDSLLRGAFCRVREAMTSVTSDPSLRYHHLRHSAASWLFLRLCLSDFHNIPDLFPKLQETTTLLRESARVRDIIYDPLRSRAKVIRSGQTNTTDLVYTPSGPMRQHAFSVAAVLGHADPSTTLENYIHFVDLVASLYLEKSEFFGLTRKAVIDATGLNSKTGYNHKVEDLPAEVWRKLPSSVRPARPSRAANCVPGKWLKRSWDFLYRAEVEQLGEEDLAAEFDLELSTVSEILRRAHTIMGVENSYRKTGANGVKFRLRSPKKLPPEERAIMDRLEPKMIDAIKKNRNLAEDMLKYFISFQERMGPLRFRNRRDIAAVNNYLAFLKELGIRRLKLDNRRNPRLSKESEIRFFGSWEKVRKSRDDIRPNRKDSSLGVVVHLGVADGPNRISEGFLNTMVMAATVFPWLLEISTNKQSKQQEAQPSNDKQQ